jgi:hypothetical protein
MMKYVLHDDLLSSLRRYMKGLITYPSPLLGELVEKLPEVLTAVVLTKLDPADIAVVAQVGQPWLAAVVDSGVPRAGRAGRGAAENNDSPLNILPLLRAYVSAFTLKESHARLSHARLIPARLSNYRLIHARLCHARYRSDCLLSMTFLQGAPPLKLAEFVGSVGRLAWARANGCPWGKRTCALAAAGGRLEARQWSTLTRYPISYCHLLCRLCHLPYRYCHIKVIFRINTVIFHIDAASSRSASISIL